VAAIEASAVAERAHLHELERKLALRQPDHEVLVPATLEIADGQRALVGGRHGISPTDRGSGRSANVKRAHQTG
jgi:hypothetical protein